MPTTGRRCAGMHLFRIGSTDMSAETIMKRSSLIRWVFVALCLIEFLSMHADNAEAFQCYVCDSKTDIECTENLPDNTRLIARDCRNISDAKYCVKTTNIYAGEFGTKRFCAANDHGNYCKYIKQPTGEREYRSCVLTCDSELCNAAEPSAQKLDDLFILILMVLVSTATMLRIL